MTQQELLNEKRLSMRDVAQRLDLHIATITRWALDGCEGRTLKTFKIGRRRFTTEQWLQEFLEVGMTGFENENPPSFDRRAERAGRQLERAGV